MLCQTENSLGGAGRRQGHSWRFEGPCSKEMRDRFRASGKEFFLIRGNGTLGSVQYHEGYNSQETSGHSAGSWEFWALGASL